ncbi:hypothetical protein [Aneurinibacillus uraniidurans]|uniref:hypothetical protein n=1 Tax=Aneurinibacillus uraniidurans TaxID=2966586 RepID=UPI002348EFC7|nr:hypothetical protein [Aneurinibacillus sp. B1]WCN39477.1 hypothetical protein PO771_08815 [Aneurinibacillus sp. B1]
MKKFIAVTTVAATLLAFPVAAFAKSYSLAELKALAQESGYTVQETRGQLVITESAVPTTPSTPSTPTTPPKDDTKTENADFKLYPAPIERSFGKDNVVQNKITVYADYITSGKSQIIGGHSVDITDKVTWEIKKGTPISVDKKGIITATKNGEYPVTISYNGKYMDLVLKVTGYQLKNGKHSAYVIINSGSATKTR